MTNDGEVLARVVVRGSDGSTRIVAGEVGELPAGVEYGPSECACGAEFCGHERTATPGRGVDRAALIEAAAEAITRHELDSYGASSWIERAAINAIDAALPLVAQAVEDAVRQDIYTAGLQAAARLVRSLAEEGQQQ